MVATLFRSAAQQNVKGSGTREQSEQPWLKVATLVVIVTEYCIVGDFLCKSILATQLVSVTDHFSDLEWKHRHWWLTSQSTRAGDPAAPHRTGQNKPSVIMVGGEAHPHGFDDLGLERIGDDASPIMPRQSRPSNDTVQPRPNKNTGSEKLVFKKE
jgi:hypothetical protein